MEQTIEAGTVASVIVNVIDDAGAHVAATIDTANTRLQKGDSSDTTWNSTTPTYDEITTGVYRINFSGLSPELQLSHNDDHVRVRINGDISGTAWSEYHLPVRVVPATPRAVIKGVVETTAVTAATTTAFTTEWTAVEPFEGRTVVFTSGSNQHLAVKITAVALDGSNARLTVEMHDGSAMPNIPSDGDTFEVV